MVKARLRPFGKDTSYPRTAKYESRTGIVVDIREVKSLFSDKYSIVETNTYVDIVCDGEVVTFDLEEDELEVIDEGR